jgi:hypothetical protein
MTGSIYSWSTTAASNGNADGDINFAEGQAPSTVNNSARQVMGRVAEYIADNGGALAAAGSANVITVTANSAFTAYADGVTLALRITTDNTSAATLNVNGLGAKSIRQMVAAGETGLVGGEMQATGVADFRYSTALNSGAGGWLLLNPAIDAPNLVTLTGSQTLTNKTLTTPIVNTPTVTGGTVSGAAIVLEQSTTPAPTAEGRIMWDTDDNILVVGDGAATQTFLSAPASVVSGDIDYYTGAKVKARLPKGPSAWNLRQNLAATIPEYCHPLAMGNFSGLKVQATSDTAVSVTGVLGLSVSAAITASGANGLDTGTEAISTWYNVFVIWNGTSAACLLSVSATAPTLPGSYVNFVRVGAVRNDGSGNFWRTLQYGRRAQVVIGTNPTSVPVITSGSTGSPTTPTWTSVAVGSFVPPTASAIRGTFLMAQSDNTKAILAPNNSYGAYNSNNAPPLGNGNSGITGSNIIVNEQFDFILESTNIFYASNNGSTNVLLNGWEDNL